MKLGIVITTHKSTTPFLRDLLDSLSGFPYPIVIRDTTNTPGDNFELAGIRCGMELFDQFIYLQDTVIVKDQAFLKSMLESDYVCYSLSPNYLMYLGKYSTWHLEGVEIPYVTNKLQAVDNEFIFTQQYMKFCKETDAQHIVVDQTFIDGNHKFQEKHGRTNMVLENQYFIKYKATWDRSQIK